MPKSVLIICYSHHASEPRLLKVVQALKSSYNLTTAGYSGIKHDSSVNFILLSQIIAQPFKFVFHHNKIWPVRKFGSLIEKIYLKVFALVNGVFFSQSDFDVLKRKKYDLIIAHHPDSLELAAKLAEVNRTKLVFNCHEYYPLEFDNNPVWMKYENPRIEKLLHQYQSKIALWLTVSNHIQKAYETHFLANCFLLYNSKRYQDITPHPVNSQNIRIIHHGAAMRERKLETMIACFMELPVNFSLTLMLMPNDSAYLAELIEKYSGVNNLFFTDIVPTNEIVSKIQRYDVGLFFLGDEIYNYKYCLPNKLFEFIQARLCVVVTPNPEMKDLVQKYRIGYVAESYSHEDCVKVLKGLTVEKINGAKNNCNIAAKELDSAKNEGDLLKVINNLCAV